MADIDAVFSLLPGASAFVASHATAVADRQVVAASIHELLRTDETIFLDAGSTCYLVAQHVVGTDGGPEQIFTNNLAVSLLLAGSARRCYQFGGLVDDIHLCTISSPSHSAVFTSHLPQDLTAVVTGAAFQVGEHLLIRARRPDQFDLKTRVMQAARRVIIALESSKLVEPFDGTAELEVNRKVVVVTDDGIGAHEATYEALRDLCLREGHELVVGRLRSDQ